jgi:4-hydroxybenzoate polyprenyltransferase
MRAALAPFRAGDWWDHKLVPALAIFYGTALASGAPVAAMAPVALGLALAVAAAAAFAGVVNDLSDRADDFAAGKPNRMRGRAAGEAALLVAAPVAVGAACAFAWRSSPFILLAYAGSWAAFSLYSLPPARLKARGAAGVAADAAGAHLFPSLTAVFLASSAAARPPDPWWIAIVAAWSLAYGVRGIIWHQLADSDNDRRAGVATLPARLSPAGAARLATHIVFPVEAAALAAMLIRLGTALPPLFLAFYVLLLALRARLLGIRPVIVGSRGKWTMALQDYYEIFLPVSILAASALVHPLDWLVLLAHLALFPRRTRAVPAQVAALAMALAPSRRGTKQ